MLGTIISKCSRQKQQQKCQVRLHLATIELRERTSRGRVATYLRYLLSLSGAGHDNVTTALSMAPTDVASM